MVHQHFICHSSGHCEIISGRCEIISGRWEILSGCCEILSDCCEIIFGCWEMISCRSKMISVRCEICVFQCSKIAAKLRSLLPLSRQANVRLCGCFQMVWPLGARLPGSRPFFMFICFLNLRNSGVRIKSNSKAGEICQSSLYHSKVGVLWNWNESGIGGSLRFFPFSECY